MKQRHVAQISQPDVEAVEGQPLGANAKRLITALNYLGHHFPNPADSKTDYCL